MKKKKRYIVILVILIVYAIIMMLSFGEKSIKEKKKYVTLIIGDSAIWNYSDESWLNITNTKTIDSLSWLDYNVYLDNRLKGNYFLWNDNNKWYIFDSNKKAIVRDGMLLATRANYEVKVKDFSTNEIRNYYHVEKVLEENNLSPSSKYTTAMETAIDIDNDGTNEQFYFVSNVFSLDYNPTKIFSFVFMVKNSKVYPIYTDVAPNKGTNGCKPYLSAVLDIDEDNTYEMVVSCGKYSTATPVEMLYKLTEDGFKILISNQ